MRFVDQFFSREGMYSIGQDMDQGGWYLSIPVSSGIVDYEEYYSISQEVAENFKINARAALDFANQCRRREHDEFLIVQPGANRGSAI